MRVYLVIMDETEEANVALRFASSRAARTGGAVHLLALIPRQPFVAFGGVQATIEEEAHARAETLVTSAETSGCSARYSRMTFSPSPWRTEMTGIWPLWLSRLPAALVTSVSARA